jgi:PAS domain S-box-containing protein
MTENLAEDHGPSLIKKLWSPQSFSNRTVRPEKLHLSVLIAIMASHAALSLGERVTASRGWVRLAWHAGGATAMGIGIWSMHYTGTLAFTLPVPVRYDRTTVLLSLLAGIFSSAAALFVVSRQKMGSRRAVAGSVFMGGGIATLHYTAMASMRTQAMCHYLPALVVLSVAVAIAASLVSISLTFDFRDRATGWRLRKALSSLVMGAAIAGMHYTGMAAASFEPTDAGPDLSGSVSISSLGTTGIGIVALMVVEIVVLTSLADRLIKQKALLDELFEQAPQAVALMNPDNRVVRVNREFTRVFGYTQEEALGRRLGDLIVPDESPAERLTCEHMVTREQLPDVEGVARRKDGSRLYVSTVCVPVSVPGRQIATYSIYRDMTQSKQSEEQLRALSASLESAREEEGIRIAREIHDELGSTLTSLRWEMEGMSKCSRAGWGGRNWRLLERR